MSLDEATEPWGVYVERVEVKDVRVPEQLQRAMAAEAEAAREARAKVIAAEGEHKASRALRHAAETISDCPSALQVNRRLTFFLVFVKRHAIFSFFPLFLSLPRREEQILSHFSPHISLNYSCGISRP